MPLDAERIRSLRQRLGRVGVWLGPLAQLPAPGEQAAARRLEELGFGSLWAGEVLAGKEAFAHQALLLAATEHVVTGTGIANVWARHPSSMQAGAATLGSAWPGRFVLGVGISHAPIVERSGQKYDRPLARMAEYLDDMDTSAAASAGLEVPVPRVLAALRPRMLNLARDRADGAHPYFVPVSHTPAARQALGTDKLLVPEQAFILATDAGEARAAARDHTSRYLGLSNYANNLRHLGYTDEDVAGAGSDRLVDDVVAWGGEEAVADRVRQHLDGGADHVLLQPLAAPDQALSMLERVAPAVLG
jgi:probable F420-dependent oxidoreductase